MELNHVVNAKYNNEHLKTSLFPVLDVEIDFNYVGHFDWWYDCVCVFLNLCQRV